MRSLKASMLLAAACSWPGLAGAQLEMVTNAEPQRLFAGPGKPVAVVFHNPGQQAFEGEVRARVLETGSTTAVRWSDTAWKRLQVLPQQTVLESARLDFPAVRAETTFLIQWLEDTNRVIGLTQVWVYPSNLLAELKPLAGAEPVGIFDPQNQIKPLLKNLQLPFTDLEISDLETFPGKLALIGPFQSRAQMREGLAEQIQTLAKKGAAVVWLQPPPERHDAIVPSFYAVPEGKGAVVIVGADLVSGLSENPQAQLHLVQCSRLALNPKPFCLPNLTR
ncbi:MAG: hypothetical protein ABSH38_18660 [Verrucomicrobiota bacterium]|jgi:hypothetical protein